MPNSSPSKLALWMEYSLADLDNEGLDGLADLPRSGRPATYSAEQVAEVIAAALSDPQKLGQPFA
jgi:hypothetical protein